MLSNEAPAPWPQLWLDNFPLSTHGLSHPLARVPGMVSAALQLFDPDDGGSGFGEAPVSVALVDDRAAAVALLEARAREYARQSKARNTWRAYTCDLEQFGAWCERTGRVALPATAMTVRDYLVAHAQSLAVSTLRRRLAAISQAHALAGVDNPTRSPIVTVVWDGIRKEHGRPPRQKEPAVTDVIAKLVAPLGESLIDRRDRALVLIGFAGAMRRSELAALDARDITETADGLRIAVNRSKTDQESSGAIVGIAYGSKRPTCPVRAWRAWVEAAQFESGPAFIGLRHGAVTKQRLTGGGVARVIKRRATDAGLDAALFSGHSLRRGFATTAFRRGVAEHRIMQQGRWSTTQAMRGYIAEGELFVDNPSAELGL